MTFGLVLPLLTAGALFAATWAAGGWILRATRTWPRVHERVAAVLGLNSFAATLALLYAFFMIGVAIWYRFL